MDRKYITHTSCEYLNRFLEDFWLTTGASELTISSYKSDLELYLSYLDKSKVNIFAVEKSDIADFLSLCLKENYTGATRGRFFSSMSNWHNWCVEKNLSDNNPLLHFKMPKASRKIPVVLTEREVEELLDAPNTADTLELRDKSMLEIIYASGLRVSELINLPLQKVDTNLGSLIVYGKGQKERIVPIGEEALYWLDKYLKNSRPKLSSFKKSTRVDEVFLNRRGVAMTRQNFWQRLKIYADRINLQKNVSPHGLRHAFATHLLNNGADLRVLQMLLGHSSLSITQIYTSINNSRLDEIYRSNHPREL